MTDSQHTPVNLGQNSTQLTVNWLYPSYFPKSSILRVFIEENLLKELSLQSTLQCGIAYFSSADQVKKGNAL